MRALALILATAMVAHAAPARSGATVTAEVVRAGATVEAPLAPGQTIFAGDKIALDVELPRAAYVYVLYVDARGTITPLYPRAGDGRVPEGVQRLPALSHWWETDDRRGEECFVVLASPSPLDDARQRGRAAACKPSRGAKPAASKVRTSRWIRSGVAKCPEPSDDPETTNAMACKYTRGPIEIAEGIVATPDTSGVATAVFWVDHRGR
jgi:hypothetical protein